MPRTIRTSLGDTVYYTLLITETHGEDISADTFEISLGTAVMPGTWHTPDVSTSYGQGRQQLKLLVGPAGGVTLPAGTYYPWVRITDNPEVESIMVNDPLTIA